MSKPPTYLKTSFKKDRMKLFIKQVAIELNSNNILFILLLLVQDDALAKLAITLFKENNYLHIESL